MKSTIAALALLLAAAPAFATRDGGSPADDAAQQQTREKIIVGFFGMLRGFLPERERAAVPELHAVADLDASACEAYRTALTGFDVDVQFHRDEFASDPQSFDIAHLGSVMGVNSLGMLCGTSEPSQREKFCVEQMAKPEPFGDPAADDIERSSHVTDRMKDVFEGVHAAVAAQSRANCAAR